MKTEPKCPKCNSENVYSDGNIWICPECSNEWSEDLNTTASAPETANATIKDANGNTLTSGDAVTVIKDLKIKGSSGVLKSGTKVKNIRLTDGNDGHNIICKIDGMGTINLKSEFVRKI